MLPGSQVLLSWNSLGLGTTYYVQTSTDLSTWETVCNTTATDALLFYNIEPMRTFRLSASNVPLQSVTLAWNPSCPATNVAGYYIYYGETPDQYTSQIDVGLTTTVVVNGLLAGANYYFATTSYSFSGEESGYSNEAVWQAPLVLALQRYP